MNDNAQAAKTDARTPTEGEVTALHNVKSRTAILAECGEQFRGIQAERSALNEQAGEIRTRLKEIGVEPKAFMAALRCADMEKEGQDKYMDTFQEAFNALGSGGQLDWVSALKPDETG